MGSTVTPMDSREHRRVRMRLPVRMRWTTPFGQKIELGQSIDVSRHASSNGSAHRREPERRGSMRKVLAIPVRVHPERIPWFEEAMTIDFSAKGMRFRSHREYAPGDYLKIAFAASASAPWQGAGEFRSKVIRIASVPGSVALDVSVCRVE